MENPYDTGYRNLGALLEWYEPRKSNRNEATTRLHLINRIFIECLGWQFEQMICEEYHSSEYADFTFHAPRPIMIAEAKKEGDYFELPVGIETLEYALETLFRDFPNLKSAIEQVAHYCQTRGVPFGIVTNGHQLVAFLATRNDGVAPFEGKAIVFDSLERMLADYKELWQTLSEPAVAQRNLLRRLGGDFTPAPPPKLSASVAHYPGIKGRNPFQAEMHVLSDLVIEDITRAPDLEREFLEECYCESGALSQHSLVSKAILKKRYAALFDHETPGPALVPATTKKGVSPDLVAESISKRPIILMGNSGVGKTVFIRHLMSITAPAQFEKAITFHLNLGSEAALAPDIRDYVIGKVCEELRTRFSIDIEEGSFVRRVYGLELARFGKGIHSSIRESNNALYLEKELEFLELKIKNREEHLRRSLDFVAENTRKQVVIFVDNSDQRSEMTQQEAFLISQEIAEHWGATVFLTLRPETFYRSVKMGALSGYHPKAFTISPPRIDKVVEKRLRYALKLTIGKAPISELPEKTKVDLRSLATIINAFLHTIYQRDDIMEFIDNMSGGNVRMALDFVKQFFGSGHVDTRKIIDIHREAKYLIPLHEFVRAIIHGDSEYYAPDQSPIANIYDISTPDPKEHFLVPLLIGALLSGISPEGFVEGNRLYDNLQDLGFTPFQIDDAVYRCHNARLVETSIRGIAPSGQMIPEVFRPTSIGIYHVNRLCRKFFYNDAVIIDTPILDKEIRESIIVVNGIEDRLNRVELFRQYLDLQWESVPESPLFDWRNASDDLREEVRSISMRISS
jgi:hypothetical protein